MRRTALYAWMAIGIFYSATACRAEMQKAAEPESSGFSSSAREAL
jgi:hypothetical protein